MDNPASAESDEITTSAGATTTEPELSADERPSTEEPMKSPSAENPDPSQPEISTTAGGADGVRSPSGDPGIGEPSPHAVTELDEGTSGSTDASIGDIGNGEGETQLKRVSTGCILRESGIGVEEIDVVEIAAVADAVEYADEDDVDVAIEDILDGDDSSEKVGVSAQDTRDSKKESNVMDKQKSSIKSPAKRTGAAGSTNLSERLYAKGMEVMRRRDELSRFEPEVGPFSPQLVTRSGLDAPSSTNRQVFSRLYEESKMKQMRDKERREAAEAAAEAELYVSPSNRKKTSAKKATDMYERSMRMKAEMDRRREETKKLSVNHPFSPTLYKGKSRGKDSTDTQRSTAERLYSSDHLQRRDERLGAAKSIVEMEGCTFSPRLMTRRKNSSKNDSAVYNRLYNKASKRDVNRSEEKEGTFTPDIGRSQRKVKASISNESAIYDRLYNKASSKKYERKPEKEEGKFAPDITSSQKKVRASRSSISVQERLYARASISPGKVSRNQSSIEASPSIRIGQLYGKGMLKAQTELIAAQEEETRLEKSAPNGELGKDVCADEGTLTSAPAEVKANDMEVSLLEMDSPKGKDPQLPSDENMDPKSNMYDTPNKHDTIDASTKDIPQAYESGTNAGNGIKETVVGAGIEKSTPGSVIGLGPKSSESVGSIEFASI